MLEEDVTAHKDDTSLTPEGIYDLLSSNCDECVPRNHEAIFFFPLFIYFTIFLFLTKCYCNCFHSCSMPRGSLLVVDIRPIAEFRGCHMRGAIHFCFDADHPGAMTQRTIALPRAGRWRALTLGHRVETPQGHQVLQGNAKAGKDSVLTLCIVTRANLPVVLTMCSLILPWAAVVHAGSRSD